MNYYFTYSDKNYIHIAERLFESLKRYSTCKIYYYTINFDYDNKFDNVIPIRYDFDYTKFLPYELNEQQMQHWKKKNMLWLKANLCNDILKMGDHNYCCIDSDMICIQNPDIIFDKINDNLNYPLLPLNCYEYMIVDGIGNVIEDGVNFHLEKCLEADLLKFLNVPLEYRTPAYKQCNLLLFNKNSEQILKEWLSLCYKPEIIKNKNIAGLNEETVLNCLLWKYKYHSELSHIHINIPLEDMQTFVSAFKNPIDKSYFLKDFCRIPKKEHMSMILFLHGRPSEEDYEVLKKEIIYPKDYSSTDYYTFNKKILLTISASGMGDALTATPTIKKLCDFYESKIVVKSRYPDLFLNNPYIHKHINYDDQFDKTGYEALECFPPTVHKKSHACLCARNCAFDLGFDLTSDDLTLQFYPYKNTIYNFDLLDNYICLHTTSNWANRTWKNEYWQQLVDKLHNTNYKLVIIGRDYVEKFFNGNDCKKKCFVPTGKNVIDFTNDGSSLNDLWHLINKSKAIITLDSGPLHLAGTTDTWIFQIGSARHPEFVAPYRKGSQNYKHEFIGGECKIFCASNVKYSVKEWNTINSIHFLPSCQENYPEMKCHPTPDQVYKRIMEKLNK